MEPEDFDLDLDEARRTRTPWPGKPWKPGLVRQRCSDGSRCGRDVDGSTGLKVVAVTLDEHGRCVMCAALPAPAEPAQGVLEL